MEKLCYLLFDEALRSGGELRDALLEKAVSALRSAGAREITIDVQDEHVASGTPIRNLDPPVRAMVAFWLQNHQDRGPCEAALAPHARNLAGYLVLESRPLVHETNPGGRSPGMNQVTCIARRKDIDYDEFFRIWHEDHRIVAIETQSTTGYVRNVIVRKLTQGAPDWDAIVEETFPIEALTDPHVFYDSSSEEEYRRRLDRMMSSVNRFLDPGPMQCTPMSEYCIG